MFSGIVEEVGAIRELRVDGEPKQIVIECNHVTTDLRIGDSVAVNGVCLTVESFESESFTIGIMPETLRRTNLGRLRTGDAINLERAVAADGRIGGHFVQGHVDGTGEVLESRPDGAALIVKIGATPSLMRYIVEKGFISVDGASLTVVEATDEYFTVSLVYHTQENATLAKKKQGELVNLEVDIVAKYVERFVSDRRPIPAEMPLGS